MQAGESYLGCHIYVDTLVARASQPEAGGCDCDDQWTCVHACDRSHTDRSDRFCFFRTAVVSPAFFSIFFPLAFPSPRKCFLLHSACSCWLSRWESCLQQAITSKTYALVCLHADATATTRISTCHAEHAHAREDAKYLIRQDKIRYDTIRLKRRQ